MDGAKARACSSTRKGGGPGGRGDGADAKLVNEVEERNCRAQCGAKCVGSARRRCPPRGATEQAREASARAVSERPKGLHGVNGARSWRRADGRVRHGGGEQRWP